MIGRTSSQPKRAIPKARLVIIENIVHQEIGKQPTSIPTRSYVRWLDTDEQPYLRHMTIGEGWVTIDRGWIEKASLCIIANEYTLRRYGHSGPTEEQKVEIREHSIEVSLRGDGRIDCTLQPGESFRLPSPSSFSEIQIRGRISPLKCLITLLPG